MKPYPDHRNVLVLLLNTSKVVKRPGERNGQFARVRAAVGTADGRGGVGWFEWNRNTSQ